MLNDLKFFIGAVCTVVQVLLPYSYRAMEKFQVLQKAKVVMERDDWRFAGTKSGLTNRNSLPLFLLLGISYPPIVVSVTG